MFLITTIIGILIISAIHLAIKTFYSTINHDSKGVKCAQKRADRRAFDIKKINKEFLDDIKTTAYTLSFSSAISLTFLIVYHYLFLPKIFMNHLIILNVISIPFILIFMFSLNTIYHLLKKEKIKFLHIFKISTIISIIASLILTIGLVVLTNVSYSSIIVESLTPIEGVTPIKINPELNNLPISEEISTYNNEVVEEYNEDIKYLKDFNSKKGICIKSKCANAIVNIAYKKIRYVYGTAIASSNFEKGGKELEYIRSESFKSDYKSLKE